MTVFLSFARILGQKTKKIELIIEKISSLKSQIVLIFQLEQRKPNCLYITEEKVAKNKILNFFFLQYKAKL
jgi:hypothetical protein